MVSAIHSNRQERLIKFMNNLTNTYPISKTHNLTYSSYGWHIVSIDDDNDTDELHNITIYDDFMHHDVDVLEHRQHKIYSFHEHSAEDIETILLSSISNIKVYVYRPDEEVEQFVY